MHCRDLNTQRVLKEKFWYRSFVELLFQGFVVKPWKASIVFFIVHLFEYFRTPCHGVVTYDFVSTIYDLRSKPIQALMHFGEQKLSINPFYWVFFVTSSLSNFLLTRTEPTTYKIQEPRLFTSESYYSFYPDDMSLVNKFFVTVLRVCLFPFRFTVCILAAFIHSALILAAAYLDALYDVLLYPFYALLISFEKLRSLYQEVQTEPPSQPSVSCQKVQTEPPSQPSVSALTCLENFFEVQLHIADNFHWEGNGNRKRLFDRFECVGDELELLVSAPSIENLQCFRSVYQELREMQADMNTAYEKAIQIATKTQLKLIDDMRQAGRQDNVASGSNDLDIAPLAKEHLALSMKIVDIIHDRDHAAGKLGLIEHDILKFNRLILKKLRQGADDLSRPSEAAPAMSHEGHVDNFDSKRSPLIPDFQRRGEESRIQRSQSLPDRLWEGGELELVYPSSPSI